MKIKRYHAADMSKALRQVRQELGPDAVILSTQSIDGGVEVCVADDSEPTSTVHAEALFARAPANRAASTLPWHPTSAASSAAAPTSRDVLTMPGAVAGDAGATNAELRSLRELLERQLAALSWNDFTRRDPVRARALDDLISLGLRRDDAWPLLARVPDDALAAADSHAHYAALADAMPTGDIEPMLQGAVALVGPPGAGKSTLLAKLAVRGVVEHGAASLAILTLDTQRLGASEQTRGIGRLLGIDTLAVDDPAVLSTLIARWCNKRLVLVDTAGLSPRDHGALLALERQLAAIGHRRTLLVLPASAQPELLEGCLARFAPLAPQAVVLTRTDEALNLGGALGALLRHPLPVVAVSDGPRVPEDLRPARGADLVAAAIGLKAEKNVRRDVDHAAA